MSDLDDLKRLEEMLAEGRITRKEYESERAWITGSTAQEEALASAPRATAGSHVIDLHEIEEHEEADNGSKGKADSKAGAANGEDAPHKNSHSGRSRKADTEPRRRIPTVWKVILVAFVVWILLLVTAVVYLRLRGTVQQPAAVTQEDLQSATGAQTQAGSVAAQGAAQDLQDNAADASYEAFFDQLAATLQTYFGTDFTIKDDGETLTVSLMGDGIAADAMYVVQGVDGAAEIWSELKVSMQALAVTCYDGANAEGAERHVVLNILNDQNRENVILSYLDGQCIYDATETADLNE